MEAPPFADKSQAPDEASLTEALGRARPHWDRLIAQAREADPRLAAEWKYYSSKSGWSCVLRDKRRNVLYLSPGRGRFLASFAIGERALAAARETAPEDVVKLIEQAPKYPEGRAVRIDVKSAPTAKLAGVLLALKMAN